jgi:non-heme chloroperoxidase
LYETSSVPAVRKPLFRATTASLNPWTEPGVDTRNPGRGRLLVVSGELDPREALRDA